MLPEAFIFDVDGTLAETEELHRRAFNETFERFKLGWHWSVDDYRELLKTTGGKERMKKHAQNIGMDLEDKKIAEIHARKTARYGDLVASGEVELRPGIGDLIDLAKSEGIRLAIATTTNRPNVDGLIAATMKEDAGEVFEVIAAGDEVKNKKPAPDIFLLALARLGIEAAKCLAFEDSCNGLISAKKAGITTLVSPSRYTADEDFSEAVSMVEEYDGLKKQDFENFMTLAAQTA